MLGFIFTSRRALASICLTALTACGGGGGPTGSPITPSGRADNQLPVVALDLGSNAKFIDGQTHVAIGSTIIIDASSSSDANGDALTFTWQLLTKPTSSHTSLSVNGSKSSFTPDALGSYEFAVTVNDGNGGIVSQVVKLIADNSLPVATTNIFVDPQSVTKAISRNATLNSFITLDASASSDPDFDVVSTSWILIENPAGSAISQASTVGSSYRFLADQLGTYRFKATTSDSKGASAITDISINVNNRAPQGLMTIYAAPTATKSTSSLTTSEGYEIALNGGPSIDPDGDPLTYAWSLVSKPASSISSVTNTNQITLGFIPDVIGTYLLKLTVTDTSGAKGENLLTITVNNHRPIANIDSNATPIALANAPTSRIPSGVEVSLRGSNSYDADGDPLTYLWTIINRPDGSVAGLSSYDSADVRFIPDKDGVYTFKLKVTDSKSAYSERYLSLVVGGSIPTINLNYGRIMATTGKPIELLASSNIRSQPGSYIYWTIDSKPESSKLPDTSTHGQSFTFSPDMDGTYIISATASDGKMHSTASSIVVAKKDWSGYKTINQSYSFSKYNRYQELLALWSQNSSEITVIDPITNSINSINLPLSVTGLGISPDGKHAAVAQDELVTYVDLIRGTVVGSMPLPKIAATNVTLTNDGFAYFASQYSLAKFNVSPIRIVDFNTMSEVNYKTFDPWAFSSTYDLASSTHIQKLNKIIFVDQKIESIEFDPFTHKFTKEIQIPLPIGTKIEPNWEIWKSEDEDFLITSSGALFKTSDLSLIGTQSDLNLCISLSHSIAASEFLGVVLGNWSLDYQNPSTYLPVIRRFIGNSLKRAEDIPMPLINGKQSYARGVFHGAQGRRIFLGQTGSPNANSIDSVQYLIYQ